MNRLIKLFLIITLLLGIDATAFAVVRYVAATGSGSGDGSSWANAASTISTTIANMRSAGLTGEIHVRGYKDSSVYTSYGVSLEVYEGISVKGGYPGINDNENADPGSYATVLNVLSPWDAIIHVNPGVTNTTVISGLTIKNGMGRLVSNYRYGGGIYCEGSPTIEYCNITNNRATYGAGICAVSGTSPVIQHNTIKDNGGAGTDVASEGVGILMYNGTCHDNIIQNNRFSYVANASGGGIRIGSYGNAAVTFCTVDSNGLRDDSTVSATGGGLYAPIVGAGCIIADNTLTSNKAYTAGGAYIGSTTFVRNTVKDNVAGDASFSTGSGGGLRIGTYPFYVRNNLIAHNSSKYGGGVYWSAMSSTSCFDNNTIVNNFAAVRGGGVYFNGIQTGTILSNNIVANHTQGIGSAFYSAVSTPYTVKNSCLFGNTTNFTGAAAVTVLDNVPNATTASVFRDYAAGDYHLRWDGACVNAGLSSVVPVGSTDLDGKPRQVGTVDVGAYEVQDGTPPNAPAVTDDGDRTVSTTAHHATWTACSDEQTGVVEYKYAIGTAAGATNVRPYTSTGTAREANATGLTLVDGTTYYFTVRAYNGDGAWSEGSSDGIKCIGDSVVFVRPAPYGSQSNGGHSWSDAKVSVTAALGAAVIEAKPEVWVAVGPYQENITLPAGIKLYGAFEGDESTCKEHRAWLANETVLEGISDAPVVTVAVGATSNTILDGFTIRNGQRGGVCCSSTSPVISHNIITGNTGQTDYRGYICGGGIYCAGGAPTITQNTIMSNTAGKGGGIYCSQSGAAIRNNTISNHTGATLGGGVFCIDCPVGSTICNNTITSNEVSYEDDSSYGGMGGGIYCQNSGTTIIGNVIKSNSAAGSGSGIYCSDEVDGGSQPKPAPTIINNTIIYNAGTAGLNVSGVYLDGRDAGFSPTLYNNIIAFNTTGITAMYCPTPVLGSNCVYETNVNSRYSGVTAASSDIQVDPMLVGVHLQQGSPCIDAGLDTVAAGSVDIDGQPRRLPTLSSPIDIGADEWNVLDNGIGTLVSEDDELSFFSSLVTYCD